MPSVHPSIAERLSYRLDNLMARRPVTKLLALFVVVGVLTIIGGIAYFTLVNRARGNDLLESMWASWTFVSDPGTHVGEEGRAARVVSVIITVGGMLFFAMLVGLITQAIHRKVDDLRRGLSRVIEEGHTLILGWSDRVLPLIHQIAIANRSEGGGVIVVLAEHDKEAMERQVLEGLGDLGGTQVVCRSGSPAIVSDLEKVAASAARSVLVLATEDDSEAADAQAIRTVLALRKGLPELRGHIVVELRDADNTAVIELVGEHDVEPIVGHDITGRLMIQCARQPGLGQVYASILGFENDELYLAPWPSLTGKRFEEAARSFPDAVICGIKPARSEPGGRRVLINPPADRVLEAGDELLALAEDDDTYRPGPPVAVEAGAPPDWSPPAPRAERLLFCGWRRDLDDMIVELDHYVAEASELTILAQVPTERRGTMLREGGLSKLKNLTLVHREGNPESRRALEELGVERFDSVLVLADEAWVGPPNQQDSRALVSLLLIRDIQTKRGNGDRATLISEICDPRTKRLVQIAEVSDYVVSNEIVSMALANVAERRELASVWDELFTAEGNEIYLKPARAYAREGEALSFWGLSARGRARGEVVLGWKARGSVEPVLNPRDKAASRTFADGDRIVVIAQDEL